MKIFEIIGILPSSRSSGYFQNPLSHEPSSVKKKSKKDDKKEKEPKSKSINKDRGTIVDIEV